MQHRWSDGRSAWDISMNAGYLALAMETDPHASSATSPYLTKLLRAAGEIVAHFLITVMSLLGIAGTGHVLDFLGLSSKMIPLIGVSLGEWIFILEVISATLINVVGIYKSIRAYGDI